MGCHTRAPPGWHGVVTVRRRSGYAHEAQRHTERICIRISPDIAARLRELASEAGETLSDFVARLVTSRR